MKLIFLIQNKKLRIFVYILAGYLLLYLPSQVLYFFCFEENLI